MVEWGGDWDHWECGEAELSLIVECCHREGLALEFDDLKMVLGCESLLGEVNVLFCR